MSNRAGWLPFFICVVLLVWEAAMKPALWMAALILALMIGGITFVVVYINNSSRGGVVETPPPRGELIFATKRYPDDEGGKALTTEVNQLGQHDFWFYNDSDQNLTVGLNKKGCTCSEVDLSIVPESWKPRLLAEAAGRLLQRAPRGLDGLPTLAATFDPKRIFPEVPAEPDDDVDRGELGRGAGRRDRLGASELATLASRTAPPVRRAVAGEARQHLNARLDVGVHDRRTDGGEQGSVGRRFDLRDLEKGKKVWIVCWSVTRPSFRIVAEPIHERRKAESDPFEVASRYR